MAANRVPDCTRRTTSNLLRVRSLSPKKLATVCTHHRASTSRPLPSLGPFTRVCITAVVSKRYHGGTVMYLVPFIVILRHWNDTNFCPNASYQGAFLNISAPGTYCGGGTGRRAEGPRRHSSLHTPQTAIIISSPKNTKKNSTTEVVIQLCDNSRN